MTEYVVSIDMNCVNIKVEANDIFEAGRQAVKAYKMEPHEFMDRLEAVTARYPQVNSEMFYLQASSTILHDIMQWEGDLDHAVAGYFYPADRYADDRIGEWFLDTDAECYDEPIARDLRYAIEHPI